MGLKLQYIKSENVKGSRAPKKNWIRSKEKHQAAKTKLAYFCSVFFGIFRQLIPDGFPGGVGDHGSFTNLGSSERFRRGWEMDGEWNELHLPED